MNFEQVIFESGFENYNVLKVTHNLKKKYIFILGASIEGFLMHGDLHLQ